MTNLKMAIVLLATAWWFGGPFLQITSNKPFAVWVSLAYLFLAAVNIILVRRKP